MSNQITDLNHNLPTSSKLNDWYKSIAIVRTDVQRKDFASEEAFIAERECIARSEQVAEMIRYQGVECHVLAANKHLSDNLIKTHPDLCLNFVDTVRGSGALASGIPGIFELLRLPYLGSGTLALSLNSNKFLCKTLLENWDIPTPRYQLLRSSGQDLEYGLRYPLVLKLNEEHGSVGIDSTSVVTNERDLRSKVKELLGFINSQFWWRSLLRMRLN